MTIGKREDVEAAFRLANLPAEHAGSIERYLFDKVEPGSFVRSILENDLVGAAAKADHINRHLLFQWADLMYNGMPVSSWGSREKVAIHLGESDG